MKLTQEITNPDQLKPSFSNLFPYYEYLGIEISEIQADQVSSLMPFQDRLIGNPMIKAIHGGALSGFLECTGLICILSALQLQNRFKLKTQEELAPPATINQTVEYLNRTGPVDTRAVSVITKLGRRVASVQTTAYQNDKVVTRAVSRYNIGELFAPQAAK
ncbi:MAG: hypothetical protein COB04_18670 [Gammaproteobacteria bacterium]|nr:MAG: hypothetical protein COB04_18670 [Gammaproteobacteria bacterium]